MKHPDKPAPGPRVDNDGSHELASQPVNLIRGFSRCRLCLDRVIHLPVGVTGIPGGVWRHAGSRYTDTHPHDPLIGESCTFCWGNYETGEPDSGQRADLLYWLRHNPESSKGEPLPVCGGCALVMIHHPNRLFEGVFMNVMVVREERGMSTYNLFQPDHPDNRVGRMIKDNGVDLFDAISDKLVAVEYQGPAGLWSRSGVKIAELPQMRKWMVTAWGRIYRNVPGPDKVQCPPHMEPSQEAKVARVLKLGREQAASAEPVMVAADRCAEIYAAADRITDLSFTAEEAEAVLGGGRVGVAVFEHPWFLGDMVTVCVAIQWALVPGGVWFIPYTHARIIGLGLTSIPDRGLVPLSTGAFAPFEGVSDDHVFDRFGRGRNVVQVLLALFRVAALPAQEPETREVEVVAKANGNRHRSGRTRPLPYRVMEVRKPPQPMEYAERSGPRSDPERDGYKIDYHYSVPPGKVWRWKGKRGQQERVLVDRVGYTAGPQDGRTVGRERVRRLRE